MYRLASQVTKRVMLKMMGNSQEGSSILGIPNHESKRKTIRVASHLAPSMIGIKLAKRRTCLPNRSCRSKRLERCVHNFQGKRSAGRSLMEPFRNRCSKGLRFMGVFGLSIREMLPRQISIVGRGQMHKPQRAVCNLSRNRPKSL